VPGRYIGDDRFRPRIPRATARREEKNVADHDPQGGKLSVKLVYYGPALSGKTTNLVSLHDTLASSMKGEMMVLETQNDRTLFFDLLPLGLIAPSGLTIKVKLFTVPGQVAHDGTRKAVLSRADGVVFVADSRRSQSINNGESFQNLADNAVRVGLDFETLPLVVQYNKRDLPDILSEEEIRERWQTAAWPLTFAAALQGRGVQETFRLLLDQCYAPLNRVYELAAAHRLSKEAFIAGLIGIRSHDGRAVAV
jgi:mutual gliding-motility protein MglA